MILLWLMRRYAWDSIWCCSGVRLLNDLRRGVFYVGEWTGPDRDLICVKRCETSEEANRWLSPRGRTPLIAAVKAALKRWKLGRKEIRCPSCKVLPGEYHRIGPPHCPLFWEMTGLPHDSHSAKRAVWKGMSGGCS